MERVIEWCNFNQGFIDVILSALTLIISVIAIVISIVTAKLPFKKKISIIGGSTIGIENGLMGIHVTATNVGNRPVMIKNIGIKIKKNIYVNCNTVESSKVILKQGESTTQYFLNENLKAFKTLQDRLKIYAYVQDTEEKKYKKYIGKVKFVKKYC